MGEGIVQVRKPLPGGIADSPFLLSKEAPLPKIASPFIPGACIKLWGLGAEDGRATSN